MARRLQVLEAIRWVVFAFGGYLVLGGVFAFAFVVRGVQRVDAAAAGAGWRFRALIAPGVALFWPFLARRWAASGSPAGRTLAELPTDDGRGGDVGPDEGTAPTAATGIRVGEDDSTVSMRREPAGGSAGGPGGER